MKQSQLFTKTLKDISKEEVTRNAELLIRGGFIHKEMAGVYSLLPLGLRIIHKIKKIIAEEMEKLGSSEILMSTLQEKTTWEKTDRWDDDKVDVWFKSTLKNGTDVGFGWSHEEPITAMIKAHVASYHDLPRAVHQFQNKLRNEVRAKSGIMRCREFIMKDMYYFAATEEENMSFYNKTIDAYMNVFKRVDLGDITFVTSASGGVFTDKFSHEFQTITDAGEDIIYINQEKHIALNEEIYNQETLDKMKMAAGDFQKVKAAEVGNIFNFGTKKSEQLDLYFTDNEGNRKPVFLSSYGIGISRLLGVLVETHNDEKGIIWPESVAPFAVHLVSLCREAADIAKASELYEKLTTAGHEVLYDDRADVRAGEKFADSDLIGIPTRIVVSPKTLINNSVEVKKRNEKAAIIMTIDETLQKLETRN